jgi:hypothetical protein
MLKQLALFVCLGAASFAQNADVKFYKLDFVIKEVEGGKTVNSRNYSTTASTDKGTAASIRTGSKIPMTQGTGGFNFIDVGVNIDARNLQEMGGELGLSVSAELSTAQPQEAPTMPVVVRQNRWSSHLIVPLKKPTVIFSSDDLNTKRQMQLELTATPIR